MLTIRDQEKLGVLLLDTLLDRLRRDYSIGDIFDDEHLHQWAKDNGYVKQVIIDDKITESEDTLTAIFRTL